jgi:PKD repeat protein
MLRKFLLVTMACTSLTSYSQDWASKMSDPSINFYDVKASFDKHWKKEERKAKFKSFFTPGPKTEEKNEGLVLYKRWEHFVEQRVAPSGDRSLLSKNAEEYEKIINDPAYRSSRMAGGNWQPLGAFTVPTSRGGAGRLNCIRFHPTDPLKIYVGAPAGGLWMTSDGGLTWTTTTDQLPTLGVSDVVVDYTDPNVIFIGTGDNDGGDTRGVGVLRSSDGGQTWNSTGLNFTILAGRNVNRLLMHPTNHNILYAGTTNGLYRTLNGGITWLRVLAANNIRDIEFKPGNPAIIYAASGNTMFRSTNTGASFSAISASAGLPSAASVSRLTIAVTAAAPEYVYLLFADAAENGYMGLYKSTDSGQNFLMQSDYPNLLGWDTDGEDDGGQGWYTLSLAASPIFPDEVVAGGVNIWRSDNGGIDWNIVSHWYGGGGNPYVHADIHDLSYHPITGELFTGCDGGIYVTNNSGGNWTDLSNGLQIGQMYRLGNSVTDPNLVIQGWQDNGTNLYSAGTWDRVLGGDGMEAFIDWSNSNYMYGESQYGGLSRSSNGGSTFSGITTGITEEGAWITPWCQDPQISTTIYAGFENVWKSTNRGTSWTKISNLNTQLTSLAVAPSDPQYIYASNGNAIYRTTDGGGSWSTMTTPGTNTITYLTVNATDPLKIWITKSGYTTGSKVFKSLDGGATWINLSNGLPNIPVNCVANQSNTNDGIYVGTDVGVYYIDNNLTSWMPFSNGLPSVVVDELEIHYGSSKLRAATYGRGLWETNIYNPASALPFPNFVADSVSGCPGLTVQFTDTSTNNPTSWLWSFPGGTPSSSTLQHPVVTYSTPGTYHNVTLVVSNASGTDSVTKNSYIAISPNNPPEIFMNGDDTLCTGQSVTLTSSNGSSYLWHPGNQTGQVINVFNTNTYSITVTDAFGCTSTSAPVDIYTFPVPAAPTITQSGDTLTSSAADGNQWFFNGSAIAGATGQSYVMTTPGIYYVAVIADSTGCFATSSTVVGIHEHNPTGVAYSMSPNPSNGIMTLNLSASSSETLRVQILDALGKKVYEKNYENVGSNVNEQIDLREFGPGFYFLSLNNTKGTVAKKLVVY